MNNLVYPVLQWFPYRPVGPITRGEENQMVFIDGFFGEWGVARGGGVGVV